MSGSIGDWPRLYGQIYKNLKPGGWVEMQEFEIKFQSDDGAFERAPTFAQWEKDLMKVSLEVTGTVLLVLTFGVCVSGEPGLWERAGDGAKTGRLDERCWVCQRR